MTNKKLEELLVRPGFIREKAFKSALAQANEQKKNLEDLLVSLDLIDEEQLTQLIAESSGYDFVNLRKKKIDLDVLNFVPPVVARAKKVIVFRRTDHELDVAMRDPDDLETINFIEKRTGMKVSPYFVSENDIDNALSKYKVDIKIEFGKIMEQLKNPELTREERDSLIVKMVSTIIQYGYENRASDVHIEPYERKVLIRFRIDGKLHDVLELSKEFAEYIVSRIKILSGMRTDVHRAAQDGKMRFATGEEKIDIRVSILPVTQGENIVLRLLSSKARQFSLASLGLLSGDFRKLKKAMEEPHGMILVTGPTGCGKTTTLYAILKILNKRDVHISTIEDPVEYDIEGISQIQVNSKTNLTFAKGLRSIVRQDPDIIMVGEIRDEETAGIAVNSALTGHLVLSTLHTNDSVTTLPRLIDMKIEPFLVASTINVVVAQRLVRKICESCRYSYHISDKEKAMIDYDPGVKEFLMEKGYYKKLSKLDFYKGSGCTVCSNTGYSGRLGIFEVLEMEENIKEAIMKRANSDELMAIARKNGMTAMLEDGMEKVLNGITTLEEVMRATKG